MRLEEMLAREAIRQTIGIYNQAVDAGRYEDLADAFVENATMEVQGGPRFGSRSEIIAALKAGAESRQANAKGNFQRHNMTSSMIEIVDPDSAMARHYIIVVTELGVDHTGIYDDRFRRAGDRWLIAHRSARMEWALPDSRFVRWLGAARPAD